MTNLLNYDIIEITILKGVSYILCNSFEHLAENAMLKKNPKLIEEWDFEKNNELGLDIYKVTYGSSKKVWWKCFKCPNSYDSSISNKIKGEGNCPYCKGMRVNNTNSLATLNPQLASEWNYNRNGNITPHEVFHTTNKKYWWICEKGHEFEQSVALRTDRYGNKGTGCPYCANFKVLKGFNDMWTTNPKLASMLLDKEDGYKYTQGAKKVKLNWKCPNCNTIIENKTPMQVKNEGLKCKICSHTISYPERFMLFLLTNLDIKFKREETFKWSNGKRYDFYIPQLNLIIETHGMQHKEGGFENIGGRTLKEEQENDRIKKEMALNNGFNFVEIDCHYSKFNYIKNSIISNKDFNKYLSIDYVDWDYINDRLKENLKQNILFEWNRGNKNSKNISNLVSTPIKEVVSVLEEQNNKGYCMYCKLEDEYYKNKIVVFLNDNLEVVDRMVLEDSINKSKIINCISSVLKYNDTYVCYEKDYVKYCSKIKEQLKHDALKLKSKEDSRVIYEYDAYGNFTKEWLNADEISSYYGVNKQVIITSLRHVGGTYKKSIFIYKKDVGSKEANEKIKRIKEYYESTSVLQIEPTSGDIINKFITITEASKALNIKVKSIAKCLNKYRKTTAGYIFVYDRFYKTEEGEYYVSEIVKNYKNKSSRKKI